MTLEFHTASESSGWCKQLFQYSDDGKTGTATFDGHLYPRGSNTAFIFRPFKSEFSTDGLLKVHIKSVRKIKDTRSYCFCDDDEFGVGNKVCFTPTQLLLMEFDIVESMVW